jgi:REP element-mobilizing transposase RayT
MPDSALLPPPSALAKPFRKSLRNAKINYRSGWFFVTVQVEHNKSLFGAVVGDKVVLNELGRQVRDYWAGMPAKHPELEVFESVLMPNHFHALFRIHHRATNPEHHLGFLMSRFKGGTGYLYGKMRRAGLVEDIGEHLWQLDYWDDLVTSDEEFEAQVRYIRENPANWSRDRYGACTSHFFGNLELLNGERVAFVASQGFPAAALRLRRIWTGEEEKRAEARGSDGGKARGGDGEEASSSGKTASAVEKPILVSTFTSAQEREALRRALAKGRRVIQVVPQGIPPESELPPALAAACRAGRALLLSPQPGGSRLDKKVAAWCNEYVLRHAREIWVGDISPNGMLRTMIEGLIQEKRT